MRGYEPDLRSPEPEATGVLRIPMRGYELLMRFQLTEPPLGYESPCGVMRCRADHNVDDTKQLRIPMRGYENLFEPLHPSPLLVTNPHAGL